MVGQAADYSDRCSAIGHAVRDLHIRFCSRTKFAPRPQAVCGSHAVAVGQPGLYVANIHVTQHKVSRQNVVQVQRVGGNRVDLIGR